MGFGQTMITAAFLVMLTLAVVNANKMIVDKDESYYSAEAYNASSQLASALITEILTKRFDSQVDTTLTYFQSRSNFDSWNAMGAGAVATNYVNPGGAADTYPYKSIRGDNGNYFDDVDDYNGYLRSASTPTMTGFTLRVRVYYVSESNTDSEVHTQQYTKRIDITVSNSRYLKTDLVYSAIAYYTF